MAAPWRSSVQDPNAFHRLGAAAFDALGGALEASLASLGTTMPGPVTGASAACGARGCVANADGEHPEADAAVWEAVGLQALCELHCCAGRHVEAAHCHARAALAVWRQADSVELAGARVQAELCTPGA